MRPQITCGHSIALALALMSNLRPGDELLSPVGKPHTIRWRRSSASGRPRDRSPSTALPTVRWICFADGEFDYEGIRAAINERTHLVTIQRSKGYAPRKTLSVERIGKLIAFIKDIKPDVICMVDNCYGEFVEEREPIEVGADMIVGSPSRIRAADLHRSAAILSAKRMCGKCGIPSDFPDSARRSALPLGILQSFYQGLFLAPTVVSGALKGAILRQIFMKSWALTLCRTAVRAVTTSSRRSPSTIRTH